MIVNTILIEIQGTDSFERHHMYIKHVTPSVRLGHHHGLFEFQDHTTGVHGHLAFALHDDCVHCMQSRVKRFQRSNHCSGRLGARR